jgi:hypothetical protein
VAVVALGSASAAKWVRPSRRLHQRTEIAAHDLVGGIVLRSILDQERQTRLEQFQRPLGLPLIGQDHRLEALAARN